MTTLTSPQEIKEVIESSNGKVFTVNFIKKNGEERTMTARLGVKKHLRGGESTTAHLDYLITAFDMQKKAYRNINVNTVRWIKANKEFKEVV